MVLSKAACHNFHISIGTASGGIPIKCTVTNQYAPLPGSTTFLNVVTKVDNTNGGTKQPSDFTITVSGNRPSPRTFTGSSSGTSVILHSGSYEVVANSMPDYSTSYSPQCSGTASGGIPIKCTVTNQHAPLPGSTTFLNVVTKVDNTNGGTKQPSDFTITVSGNRPSPRTFTGSSSGTSVILHSGSYEVVANSMPDYSTSYSPQCSGTASGGIPIKCTVTNQYAPLPGSTTFLNVVTKVDNTNGGTKQPSDFTITVSGNRPSPRTFTGSSSGTSVILHSGSYEVVANSMPDYSTSYSPQCSGTASGGIPIKCTVTNQHAPLPGSTTFLNVVTKVDNTNGGTKQPSDFTITVSGNRPSPRTFTGSSSGTSVILHSGSYEVVANSMPDYSTSYSPECSGTASGGIPIKCTVTNQHAPLPGSTTFLNVVTKVDNTNGGTKQPSDFTITVSGNRPSPRTFTGSSSGTSVILHSGSYEVVANSMPDYSTSYSPQCSGTASGGIPIKCTVTNQHAPLPGSTTFLNVVTKVDNTNGGTKQPSDFTITVSGNRPSPRTFTGSSSGTSVILHSGSYEVVANSMPDYSTSYSPQCSGTASGGIPIKCTVTNQHAPLPGSTTFLNVVTKVDNTNGGTKQPSDFTITVSGNRPSPRTFTGSSSGTSVILHSGSYEVVANSMPDYSTSYSPQCSGTASGGIPIKCTVTNQHAPLPGSTTFLNVVTKVDNTNGGTKQPSDFTITVSGNRPSPRTFTGSSIGTSVRLHSGSYEVVANSMPDYSTSYSPECSGTASGGVPIKCTINNEYHGKPIPPSPANEPLNTTITSDSNSVYSIPSTFVKVDRFSTNYTIAGKISFINGSRDLIKSTIVDNFDKNPNIGYVVSNSSSLSIASQLGLPNPFVSKDIINQKITNESQNAITAASVSNPPEKSVEIKCTFGMFLADYKCTQK